MAKKQYRVLKFGGLGGGQISQAAVVTADDLRAAFDMKPADIEKLVASKDLEEVDSGPTIEAPAPEPKKADSK